MLVNDLGRRDETHDLHDRLRNDEKEFVDDIGVAATTRQQGKDALADKEQQRDFDERAQDADDEKLRMSHGMFELSCLT